MPLKLFMLCECLQASIKNTRYVSTIFCVLRWLPPKAFPLMSAYLGFLASSLLHKSTVAAESALYHWTFPWINLTLDFCAIGQPSYTHITKLESHVFKLICFRTKLAMLCTAQVSKYPKCTTIFRIIYRKPSKKWEILKRIIADLRRKWSWTATVLRPKVVGNYAMANCQPAMLLDYRPERLCLNKRVWQKWDQAMKPLSLL